MRTFPALGSRFALASALLCAAPPLGGQASVQEPATFTESIEVRVVNVDVVVLDSKGRPVPGLSRQDFELLVDGQPVEISNFAAYEEVAAADGGDLTLRTPGSPVEKTPANPLRAAPTASWIVYIDQFNLEIPRRNEVLRETRDFLASSLRSGDRTMVATFDGRSLKVLSPLSADRQLAVDALDILQRQVGVPSGLAGKSAWIRDQIGLLNLQSRGAQFEIQNISSEIENLAEMYGQLLRANLTAFRDLLAMTASSEGRVAVLYAGGGFDPDPTENLARMLEARSTGRYDPAPDLRTSRDLLNTRNRIEYSRLLREVNAARVTVFSIFGGDRNASVTTADIGGSPGVSGPPLVVQSPEASSTLSAFATETGGRAFVAAPDLAERLESARQALTTYYSLGYHPLEKDPGTFHEVRVRVRGEGLRAIARRGVQERTFEQIGAETATAALIADAPPANPLGVKVQIGDIPKPAKGRSVRIPVLVRVPLKSITLVPEGAVHRAQLSFSFSLRDPDGGYRRLEERPLDFSVPAEKLEASLNQAIGYQVELQLEPGEFQLAVGVVDKLSSTTSAATTGFSVPRVR